VEETPATQVSWNGQDGATGPGVVYDVAGGDLSALRSSGLAAATGCVDGDLGSPSHEDLRPDPAVGDGYYYVIRAENTCGDAGFGAGRGSLDVLDCAGP
jgi:hypothetical protein